MNTLRAGSRLKNFQFLDRNCLKRKFIFHFDLSVTSKIQSNFNSKFSRINAFIGYIFFFCVGIINKRAAHTDTQHSGDRKMSSGDEAKQYFDASFQEKYCEQTKLFDEWNSNKCRMF